MGIYRMKVIQHGTIIVDGVDSLEDAFYSAVNEYMLKREDSANDNG